MSLANGQTFAGYRILGQLGSGAVGEVYLAQHPRLPRKDALKVLAAEVSASPEYRARFAREADLASKLWHPHIVGVHDRGEDDGRLWISMDYVGGLDAARLLTERFPDGMPAPQVGKIVTAVASALDYAHDQGLLHRDVKPANIMLTDDGLRIVLADFGIARALNEISSLTATGFAVGTIAYAAPEQLTGGQLDGRTDQYALAATAYELLTGSQLFPHPNPAVVIGRQLNEKPPALCETRPELVTLDPVLAKALAKNPDDRFRRCIDFANALTSPPDRRSRKGIPVGQVRRPPAATKRATGTRPMTVVPPPVSTTTDSVFIPPEATDINRPRSRWPIVMGAIVVPIVLAAIAFAVWPWPRDDRATNGTTITPTSATTSSATSSVTFNGMRDLALAYYADLPANTDAAWAKLDEHYKEQTGFTQFRDFWATIKSVTVISVSPRDATSVIARLRYIRRSGQSDSEDRWLKMVLVNGELLIDESGRIGSVA